MLVSFGSLFLSTLLGSLLHKENIIAHCGVGAITSVFYGLILWWIYWGFQIGIYGPAPFFLSILVGTIIGAFIAAMSLDGDFKLIGLLPGSIIFICYLLYLLFFVLLFSQSSMVNSKNQAALIGDVKTVSNLNDLIKPADNAHICQVSIEIAKTSAQNALSKLVLKDGVVPGSRYVIGEPTKQFVDGSYWWIFPLEFDGWLKCQTLPSW